MAFHRYYLDQIVNGWIITDRHSDADISDYNGRQTAFATWPETREWLDNRICQASNA